MTAESFTLTPPPEQSEAKFTPGPWTVILRGEHGTFHIPEAQKHEAATVDDGVDGHTVSSANARLIAVAPDMAAFLEVLASDASAYPWHAAVSRLLEQIRGAQ